MLSAALVPLVVIWTRRDFHVSLILGYPFPAVDVRREAHGNNGGRRARKKETHTYKGMPIVYACMCASVWLSFLLETERSFC